MSSCTGFSLRDANGVCISADYSRTRFVYAVRTQLGRPNGNGVEIKTGESETVICKPEISLCTIQRIPQRDDAHHEKIAVRRVDSPMGTAMSKQL